MGTLDQPAGSTVERKIKFVEVTGLQPSAIETAYNTNYGKKGWRLIQIIVIGAKTYIMAEKEI